jgi:hypothetical protein
LYNPLTKIAYPLSSPGYFQQDMPGEIIRITGKKQGEKPKNN